MDAVDGRTTHDPRRGWWVSSAAAIQIIAGGIGIFYAPILAPVPLPPSPLLVIVVGTSVLSIASGIGLLGLHEWARFLAGGLACWSLFLSTGPLIEAPAGGSLPIMDLVSVAVDLVVLFAVTRRWPRR